MRGEKAPKGTGWTRATIGNAVKNRSYQFIWCEDCGHRVTLSAQELIDRGVPPDTPFWTLAQRLRCSACGGIKVGIQAASWDRKRDNPEQL